MEDPEEQDSPGNDIQSASAHNIGEDNHDTIGMIVIDHSGRISAGTSTNGLTYKIPG